jgi:hypothetical protein
MDEFIKSFLSCMMEAPGTFLYSGEIYYGDSWYFLNFKNMSWGHPVFFKNIKKYIMETPGGL